MSLLVLTSDIVMEEIRVTGYIVSFYTECTLETGTVIHFGEKLLVCIGLFILSMH